MRRQLDLMRVCKSVLWVCGALAVPCVAQAQTSSTNIGFSINRYEPTAAGEWSFLVDHPWYSSLRYFAAGVTLNYAHSPLVFGREDGSGGFLTSRPVIEHQLLGHVDLAGSFLDRVQITASLPVTFLERGTPAYGISPSDAVVVGDPRLGAWVRLFGQPYRSAVSLSLGAQVWIPLRGLGVGSAVSSLSSEQSVRVLPKIALGGLSNHVLWSFTAGFLYRPAARLGTSAALDDAGSSAGSEVQLGAALAYANTDARFSIGPEAQISSVVLGSAQVKPFTRDFTSLEVLLGLHYNIARLVNVGVAGGIGVLRTPGTPDGRVLLRIAYAPWAKEKASPVGTEPLHQPPKDPGPEQDRDGDGVIDRSDICPDTPAGKRPDSARPGCPMGDRDNDEVLDGDDLCPEVAKGATPDPNKLGCPLADKDLDGVTDAQDQCPEVPQGTRPDPAKPGCPVGDRDKDLILDPDDACPDQPGQSNPDPARNGCPSLVVITNGRLQILQPVFFATNKDVILARSFPVLQSVADVLKLSPEFKKIVIEGHTDNRGQVDYNTELSARRAQSVLAWLVAHGVAESRLAAQGYGPTRPLVSNDTAKGRRKNRRVEFLITDPPQARATQVDPGRAGAATEFAAPGEDGATKPVRKQKKRKR